ncbi:MAG TPA: NAD(P)-dependent oxidoreductase [Candidatus Solibacter sp.]|jgi:3-hydroxyisobutyrate dehydrogenase-like beta-hydroxyacid dehydrogenase|nr:NAD(P)-dependent oxidoreductase [Candidatus Solibacter sp.]
MNGRQPVVGFVGLGAMGSRMAARLVESGYSLVVYNRTPGRAVAVRGAQVAETPAEVAGQADVVCGCLLNGAAVEAVYLGAEGLVGNSRSGQVYVEHGTFAPELARGLARLLEERGAAFLDAPVTGGPEAAASGSLTMMAGGSGAALAQVFEVLHAYAGRLSHIGPSGAGLELKLVNQLLVSCHVAAAAEASALIRRLNLPLEASAEVLNAGWGGSAMLARSLQRLRHGELGVSEATIGGLLEPQALLRDLARDVGLNLTAMPAAAEMFRRACEAGSGSLDLAAMVLTAEAGPAAVET